MTGISHMPRCYASSVAMATRVRHSLHLVRRFLRMRCISHIPHRSGKLVAKIRPQ